MLYYTIFTLDPEEPGDATEIFAAMVRRPFWREVALFLAGLRKPKEKADLLIRAKSLDDDENGWRQDGRTITLQLLQEGAFSEPKYVFTEALKFVIEALDYRKVRFQNEPESLVSKLIAVLRQEDSRQVYPVIKKLTQDFQSYDDEYAIYRLYSVTSQVLETSFVVNSILNHRSQSFNLGAKLRLPWAYHWNLDMRDESRNAVFWEVASSHSWAECWWSEAIRNSKATNVLAPSEIHQKLVVKFAMSTIEDLLPRDTEFIKPLSNWAIWKLLSYVQILSFSFNFREDAALNKFRQETYSIPNLNDLDFSGLDESVSVTIRYLLDLYLELLNSIIEKSNERFFEVIRNNAANLLTYLRCEGLASLVTLQ